LNLQYMRYAIEVEKAGSISKAAENLFMSQPNLSKAIKELETMIGVPLFNRTTKGVSSITEDGRVFIEYAQNILVQLENMKQHFQHSPAGKNSLRLSVPRASYISEAFASFVNELGSDDFSIKYYETSSFQAIENVSKNECDFGIIRYLTLYENTFLSLLQEKELEHRTILTSDGVIVMNAQNKLAGKPALRFLDLETMIEIVNDDFSMPRRADGDKESHVNKKRVYVYERGSQFDLLTHVPDAFMWVSPMPKDVLARNTLVQKQCPGKPFQDVLIVRKGHDFSDYERLFISRVEQLTRFGSVSRSQGKTE